MAQSNNKNFCKTHENLKDNFYHDFSGRLINPLIFTSTYWAIEMMNTIMKNSIIMISMNRMLNETIHSTVLKPFLLGFLNSLRTNNPHCMGFYMMATLTINELTAWNLAPSQVISKKLTFFLFIRKKWASNQ